MMEPVEFPEPRMDLPRKDWAIYADADLDECTFNKTTIFNFAAHRRPEAYGIITAQAGATPPPEE